MYFAQVTTSYWGRLFLTIMFILFIVFVCTFFFLRAAAEFCVWQKSSEYTSDVTRLWANRCLRSCPFWNEKRGVTLEVYCMLGPSLKVISARQSSLAQNVPEILAIRVFFSMKMERSYHSHPSDGDRIQCWPAVGFTLPAPFSPNLISF